MPSWFTTFNRAFAQPELAREAILALIEFAPVANIPKNATWKVWPRGIGLVVTAEWKFSDPGAVPALEVDTVGGIPVVSKTEKEEL